MTYIQLDLFQRENLFLFNAEDQILFHDMYQFGGDRVSHVLNDSSPSELPFWVHSSVLNRLLPEETYGCGTPQKHIVVAHLASLYPSEAGACKCMNHRT